MTMSRRLAPLFAAALAITGLTACDLNFVPELADDAGETTARISVSMGSANSDALDAEIDGVEVEVLDVLVHSVDNDVWYLLNESTSSLALPNTQRNVMFKDAPIPAGEYDKVMVAMQGAQVAARGGWRHVELVRDVVEIDAPMLLDRDGTIDLRFDLDGTITGDFEAGYAMTPALLVALP